MGTPAQHSDNWPWPAATRYGAAQASGFVLVCEHASAFIPPILGDLGLSPQARFSHAAWDIGAQDLAEALADALQAPLILGAMSRLVYDCNRPLDAPDCVPARSEVFDVPGNATLSAADRDARYENVHQPFHGAVADTLDAAAPTTCLVTVHTFTPVYNGQTRAVEVGFLFHDDDRLATAALAHAADTLPLRVALNEPYSATDGVTHMLQTHGQGRPHLMIEVRNDLVNTADKARTIAMQLATALQAARAQVLQ